MFKTRTNEAVLKVRLAVDAPLLIRSGEANSLEPALPDMRFVRCQHEGKQTVYMPGSSLKGVFRMRYEQLALELGQPPCNPFDKNKRNCSALLKAKHEGDKEKEKKYGKEGTRRYRESCAACRLFGSLELGGRIQFTDAYPVNVDEVKYGIRNVVGINRGTGAASSSALFDYEAVESGTFAFAIRFTNFEPYQLALVLEVLNDVDNGFVAFGMGASRGNGAMKVVGKDTMPLVYRSYQGDKRRPAGVQQKNMFMSGCTLHGMEEILRAFNLCSRNDLEAAMAAEGWEEVLFRAKQ